MKTSHAFFFHFSNAAGQARPFAQYWIQATWLWHPPDSTTSPHTGALGCIRAGTLWKHGLSCRAKTVTNQRSKPVLRPTWPVCTPQLVACGEEVEERRPWSAKVRHFQFLFFVIMFQFVLLSQSCARSFAHFKSLFHYRCSSPRLPKATSSQIAGSVPGAKQCKVEQ